jgi:hypothetical protein
MTGDYLSRTERLQYINEILNGQYGFAPMVDQDLGEAPDTPEILNLIDVIEIGEGRIEATFKILDTDGDEKQVTKRLGGTIIYVIPVITQRVHGVATPTIQLCARWRIEHRGWQVELPNGLEFDRLDTDFLGAFNSPSHRILARTFGVDFVDGLSAARLIEVHELFTKNEFAPVKVTLLAAELTKPTDARLRDGMRLGIKGSDILHIVDKGQLDTPLTRGNKSVTIKIREGNTVGALLHAARKYPRYFS